MTAGGPPDLGDGPAAAGGASWERRVVGALDFVRRRVTGDYEIDEFGFDRDLTENVLLPTLRPLFQKWFRGEVAGIENVPATGPAMVVANHAGTIAIDAVMTAVALHDHHPARRHLRMLGADLVFRTPLLGDLSRKAGHTLACNADTERLLAAGELVGVWPEGYKGVGKPFSERYQLQRFGRGGFVSVALRAGVPIVPCAIVGAEEAYPLIGRCEALAKVFDLPYFPVTPTFPWLGPLGLLPLPSKWLIEFGEPVETAGLQDRADDPVLVFELSDLVRDTIQDMVYRLLEQRGPAFTWPLPF